MYVTKTIFCDSNYTIQLQDISNPKISKKLGKNHHNAV